MDKKKMLYNLIAGKKFKVEPLNSKVYFFHFSWKEGAELEVLIGDTNTNMGKGLMDCSIIETPEGITLIVDGKTYIVQNISIPYQPEGRIEIVFSERTSGQKLRLRELEAIQY